ncbi:MAG: alpha/beta-type small acid-soluble spore protein [Clostridia bacterium]|nr:alpha/beta-type small acid-soluble spore protein [Clostridia bacterium]
MNTGSSSSTGTSREMKQRLSGFKNEVASSMNINLQQGYNGDISAREAGRIGGQMVKRMIEYAERNMNGGSMMN